LKHGANLWQVVQIGELRKVKSQNSKVKNYDVEILNKRHPFFLPDCGSKNQKLN